MKQWEINSSVRKMLTLNWIDVDVLLVNTVGNTIFLKGSIKFQGRLIREEDGPAVNEHLSKVEEAILEIQGLEFIKWELSNWIKSNGEWKRLANIQV
jgi:hypothetical protein